MTAAPDTELAPEEAEVAARFHRETRAPSAVAGLLAVAALVAALPLVPGVKEALGVTAGDTARAMGVFAIAFVLAAAAYRATGLSPLYRRLDALETWVTSAACLSLVHASGHAVSIFWIFYALLAFYTATTSVERAVRSSAAPLAVPAALLVAAFARRSVADAAISAVFAASVIWVSVVLGRMSTRLAAALREQRRLEAEARAVLVRDERSRIARDLHDGLGADLAGLAWEARALAARADDPEVRRRLAELAERARAGIADLRASVWAMRAASRAWPEVTDEIVERCRGVCRRARLVAEVGPSDVVVDGALAGELLRAAMEAVHNADLHAEATSVTLRARAGDELVLVVEDDGRGVPPEALGRSEGGLHNLRERAARLGGRLQVERRPQGTRVELALPARADGGATPPSHPR